jgi:hypothetical protein
MSLTSDAQEAHTTYEKLMEVKSRMRVVDYWIGLYLKELKENNRFKKAVGDMTWRDFLSQPEIGIPVRHAEFLIEYQKLCNKTYRYVIHCPDESLKFLVKYKDDCTEDMIKDAESLSVKDFKERYHEKKTNDAPKTYEYVVMKKCKETGSLTMEHTVRSADIEKALPVLTQHA